MPFYHNAFLLDDDPVALYLLEITLNERDIARQILSFTTFPALLKAFSGLAEEDPNNAHLPDLLVLDLNMPGKDGFEVLEQLLQIPGIGGSKVCVFLLTASPDPRQAHKVKQYSIRGYLEKPLDDQAIGQLIQAAVKQECELKEIDLDQ